MEGIVPIFFKNQTMIEIACEPGANCNIDQQTFKAYLARWMAASVKVAPWTHDTIMPLIRTSALAAAKSVSVRTLLSAEQLRAQLRLLYICSVTGILLLLTTGATFVPSIITPCTHADHIRRSVLAETTGKHAAPTGKMESGMELSVSGSK